MSKTAHKDAGINAEALTELQNTAAVLASANTDERDTLNQLIGQIQMTGAIAKLTTVVGLTKLAHIKETRMYKALAGKTGLDRHGEEIADVGTWEGFCLAIGTTRQKADEDILNLKSFGEEALEDLGRIGAGYRELRQFRKLPDDQKDALIEVAKEGDRDAFLDLAEELVARNAKLTTERDDIRADYDAQRELLKQKSQALDEARQETAKAQRRLREATPDEAERQLKIEISGLAVEIESLFKTRLDTALQTLAEHTASGGTDQRLYMASLVQHFERELDALRHKYDLPMNLTLDATEGDFDWLEPGALEAAEASVDAMKGDAEH